MWFSRDSLNRSSAPRASSKIQAPSVLLQPRQSYHRRGGYLLGREASPSQRRGGVPTCFRCYRGSAGLAFWLSFPVRR